MMKRVRHHTDDAGLKGIRQTGGIRPSRGWFGAENGVHVEVEPFGSPKRSRAGGSGPKNDLGCVGEGAYVEFDAPDSLMEYSCGPRNAGIVPIALGDMLLVESLHPEYVHVRQHFWQWWRGKVK